jgi:hypothetical protein
MAAQLAASQEELSSVIIIIIIIACLPVGATALGEPWFPLQLVSTWC